MSILQSLQDGKASAIQPPHWLVEAMSVFSREAPPLAEEALEVLKVLDLPVSTETAAYSLGARLSRQLKHHMFDTLYHAVALENEATLVTADDAYFAKAYRLGNIELLTNYPAV